MPSVKNVPAILEKIVSGTAPAKFTTSHLKNIGFPSSNDRAVIPLLKDLGFLAADGSPTKRYHEYRDSGKSRRVLGEGLREAYEEVFHVNATPTKADREAIKGTFKSVNNVGDRIADLQTMTFFAFLDRADVKASVQRTRDKEPHEEKPAEQEKPPKSGGPAESLQL